MDISPKVRSELSKLLKFEKKNIISATSNLDPSVTIVNNIEHNYESRSKEISDEELAMISVKVENQTARLLVDTCSNINVITSEFLNKLTNYEKVGTSSSKIRQAAMDCDSVENPIVRLSFFLGELRLTLNFRVIENADTFYDMLIGLKAQADNKLVVLPHKKLLVYENEDGSLITLASLNYNIPEEKFICLLEKLDDPLPGPNVTPRVCAINSSINSTDGNVNLDTLHSNEAITVYLTPTEFIHHQNFRNNLDEEFADELISMLENHIDVLATSSEELTPSLLPAHRIDLRPGTVPIKQRAYRLSKAKSDILKEELSKLINKKLIVPSTSPWSSPVILVPKHNGKWRLCVDFRRVNQVTIRDAYSLPLIDEIFDSLEGATIFTTLDLFSGYHQIPMDPESIPVTSFTTLYGNFSFRVMPFGLTNAPASFQRSMNQILFPLIGKCVYVFLDDILIFSKTKKEHIRHIGQVLSIFQEYNLKLNLEKCSFMKSEVLVLGHLLTSKGLKPQQNKVEAIKNWESPKNISELRSFLGAVGYYRQFIPNFASLASPLVQLLKKNVHYLWSSEQEHSFLELKRKLTEAPVLSFPKFDRPFVIRTDASYNGLGGVLLQKGEEGIELPIHYISRSLSKAETHYGITDLEGAALFYCISKFKSYITGSKFPTKIITDHKPLIGLLQNKEPSNARHARWCLSVSTLGIIIEYDKGKHNVVADALSRLSNKDKKIASLSEESAINEEEINTTLINKFLNEKFFRIDDVLYFKDSNNYREVVEDETKKIELILKAHQVGHERVEKTYERLKKKFYWRNMIVDIKRVLENCHVCKINRSQKYPEATERFSSKVEGPFVHMGLDIIGPLPVTKKGSQYIIVLVDYFTKWVEAEPLRTITSVDVTNFLSNVFARHGAPEVITTDNGVQFSSDYTKLFLDLYDVYVRFTSTYHPESNGLTENRNKEIGKYLRLLGKSYQEWDEVLPAALWALRTVKNSTTKFSSFELVYGRTDHQPFEMLVNSANPGNSQKSSEEILMEKFINHKEWIKEACQNVKNANKYWSMRREEKLSMNEGSKLKTGDKVYVRNFSRHKLEPYFLGPFEVIKVQFNTVTLADPNSGELLKRNVHFKNLIRA